MGSSKSTGDYQRHRAGVYFRRLKVKFLSYFCCFEIIKNIYLICMYKQEFTDSNCISAMVPASLALQAPWCGVLGNQIDGVLILPGIIP